MKINGCGDMKRNVRAQFNKIFLSIVGLSVLSLFWIMVAFTQNAAAVTSGCDNCHSVQANEIAGTYHGGVSQCGFCHTGGYTSTPWYHPGTPVTETRCRVCHIEGANLNESHGNHNYGQNKADCTQCHLPNATIIDPVTSDLYKRSHNLTVEYNYYNYGLYDMPLSTNNGTGIGMFPYYTCTLTCHNGSTGGQSSIEEEAIGWDQSAHANSRHGSSDGKNSCAKCKSPPNFNGNASDTTAIAAADWQGIQCRVCHNLHNDTYSGNGSSPIYYAYYNSTLSAGGSPVYETVSNATALCEKCHLTFNVDINSTHNSNYAGYHKDTVGFDCADCHMNNTFNNNYTHTFEVRNTASGVTGCEVCHSYIGSHTSFSQRSYHDNKVDCIACHDQTFTTNASGYAVYAFPNNNNYSYGLWNASGNWTTYMKKSSTSIKSWPLHNITRSVTCTKCHNATSAINGTIAPALVCSNCHSSYSSAVNSSSHNRTLNPGAPDCTDCHAGYQPSYGHTTGTKGYIVNESNTCRNSGCHEQNVSGFYERHTSTSDCTACHFANTTQSFSLNTSLFTHDHNLTVEHNFYEYNQSGMPVRTNGGVGAGMFPYYTCTLTCHRYNATTGVEGKIDEAANSWFNSSHARSLHYPASSDNKNNCAKCKSPVNYNDNLNATNPTIAAADWQGIQCRVCHNLHDRRYPNNTGPSGFPVAFYNSTNSSLAGHAVYEAVTNATVLCEKCHFPSDVDPANATHDSRYAGYHKDTVGFNCTDCHMNSSFNNELHEFEVKNTTSGITGCTVCHDYTGSHTSFSQRSYHDNKVDCVACHDQTITTNASGYAVYAFPNSTKNSYGLWNASGNWTTYMKKSSSVKSWPLHNITRSVTCTKCHNAISAINGTIAPALTCSGCHTSYSSAVNSSSHNRTLNPGAPDCTGCHAGYQPSYGHTTGTKGYIVNESNTCRNSGCHEQNISGFYERHTSSSDCTTCHFANTTQRFNLNTSLFTHDHNLTVEHNFYEYNTSKIPVRTNDGDGVGMFPYFTCTLTCHNYNATTGVEGKIDEAAKSWFNSSHARSLHMSGDNKNSCAKCKSPPNYNASASSSNTITAADWQGIQCRVCHNLHDRKYPNNTGPSGFPVAFYNSTSSSLAGHAVYDQVPNATALCENCHTGASHDSKFAGTHKDSVGFNCTDCHMNSSLNNELHKFEVKNTTTDVEGCEVCHTYPGTAHLTISGYHENVTCWACHDQTVSRNATNYSISSNNNYGLYKDTTTNKWVTYKVSHGSAATWPLHNITRNVTCAKCHGARSLYTAGGIAPGFGSDLTYTSHSTDSLVSGYNLIAIRLLPDPVISAKSLLYPSSGGIPGVTKVMKWDSTNQIWSSYEYIVADDVYLGTNFTMGGYKGYFIKGNTSTVGQNYTFQGIR